MRNKTTDEFNHKIKNDINKYNFWELHSNLIIALKIAGLVFAATICVGISSLFEYLFKISSDTFLEIVFTIAIIIPIGKYMIDMIKDIADSHKSAPDSFSAPTPIPWFSIFRWVLIVICFPVTLPIYFFKRYRVSKNQYLIPLTVKSLKENHITDMEGYINYIYELLTWDYFGKEEHATINETVSKKIIKNIHNMFIPSEYDENNDFYFSYVFEYSLFTKEEMLEHFLSGDEKQIKVFLNQKVRPSCS